MTIEEIIFELKKHSHSNSKDKQGMARFGINPERALGVRAPVLRLLAKKIGKDHKLASGLWKTKIHEARILASMIDEPEKVTAKQTDQWVKCFNSWDLCDQCCINLFSKLPFAWEKAIDWSKKEEEFERRAGFALMACLAWQNKKANDEKFVKFFPIIKKYANDERNFVKKAVNWALRQIGKRNRTLNKQAINLAKEFAKIDSPCA